MIGFQYTTGSTQCSLFPQSQILTEIIGSGSAARHDNYDSLRLNYNKDDDLLRLKYGSSSNNEDGERFPYPNGAFSFSQQIPTYRGFRNVESCKSTDCAFLASQLNPIWLASQIE